MLRPSSKPIVQNMNIAGLMDVNAYADVLGTSPAYRQKESIRWNSAFQLYQQMSSHEEELLSPPNSPVEPSAAAISSGSSSSTPPSNADNDDKDDGLLLDSKTIVNSTLNDGLAIPPSSNASNDGAWSTIYRSMCTSTANNDRVSGAPQFSLPISKYGFMTPPTIRPRPSGTPKMGGSYVSPGESSLNSLELEAIAAVHELQFAVKDIFVSELLPRTSELIFLNLTTLEGQAYCVELTMKGWRVTSLRHDCMNGDFTHLDLHTRYFETIYALMDNISVNYRQKFSETLASKLTLLQELEKIQTQQQETKMIFLQNQLNNLRSENDGGDVEKRPGSASNNSSVVGISLKLTTPIAAPSVEAMDVSSSTSASSSPEKSEKENSRPINGGCS